MHGCDCGQGRGVNRVHHLVNALQVRAGVADYFCLTVLLNPAIEFPQVSTGAESGFQGTVQDEGVRFGAQFFEHGD